MKKPIKMLLLNVPNVKNLEPEFTTEKEEGDNSKPKVLMMFGRCEDCKTITMCNLIKTEDIPTPEDYDALNVKGVSQ